MPLSISRHTSLTSTHPLDPLTPSSYPCLALLVFSFLSQASFFSSHDLYILLFFYNQSLKNNEEIRNTLEPVNALIGP